MIRFYLIRHSMTEGNKKRRYIGTTDEPLCPEGVDLLRQKTYPEVDGVYASPRKRCLETAAILYPDKPVTVIPDLAECEFGDFENKSAEELKDNPAYQAWVDSMGTLPFPGGESGEDFRKRSLRGFLETVDRCKEADIKTAALVVHGGTIMSIMEVFGKPKKEYYAWQAANGEGYLLEFDSYEEPKRLVRSRSE